LKETQNPLVSIIVRTKDRPKFLRNALRSIAAQDYRPIEVVLVNDGGCDLDVRDYADVLGDVALNYLRLEKNTGRAHAGNVGIKNAAGRYVGFLDDDDSFYPDHLSTLVGVLNSCDCRIVYSDAHIAYFDHSSEEGERKVTRRSLFSSKDFSYHELLMDNYIPLLCILFSGETIREVKGFDEKFDLYEDWDMLIRIAAKCPFHHVKKVTVEYLQWSPVLQVAQSPESADKAWEAHLRILRKHGRRYTPAVIREFVQYKRALGGKEERVETLQHEKAGLEHSLVQRDDEIKALKNRCESLEKSLSDKEGTIDYLMNMKRSLEDSTVDHLKNIKMSIDDTLRERQGVIEGLSGTKADLENRLRERERVIEDLKSAKANLERKLGEKEGLIEDLKSAKANLEQTAALIEGLSAVRSDLEQKVREREGMIESLNVSRADLGQRLRENEALIEDLRNAQEGLARTAGLVEGLNAVKSDLEQKVREREGMIESLNVSRADLEQRVREKEGLVEDLKTARARLEQALGEKEESLKNIFASHGWRSLLVYYGLRDRLLPENSARRKIAKGVWGGMLSALATLRGTGERKERNPFDHLQEPPAVKYEGAAVALAAKAGKPSAGSTGKRMPASIAEPAREKYRREILDSVRQGSNGGRKCSVLVAGVYLANQENTAEHIVNEMKGSKYHAVSQKWAALFGNAVPENVKAVTALGSAEAVPKFVLLNKLLAGEALEKYDYILLCDDDIWLPPDFLDTFLFLQERYDFAVAQPARTHNSYIDHPFVEQLDGLIARRTLFVEIGPLVSIRRDAFSSLLPFDESSYMGWGYDFVWPCIIEKMGLRMGVIDAVPVDHSLRRPVKNYNYDAANKSQEAYLSRNPHLSRDEAFRILESYS
jgi:glycosyltransferase involved in cell wall biosynthesis/TolA-binding protein